MRPTKDDYFMDMAKLVATRSTCLRRHVGCVLVDARGHVLATGYNGVPSGWAHCNESPTEPRQSVLNSVVQGSPRSLGSVQDMDVTVHKSPGVGWSTLYPNACPAANAASGTNLSGCRALHAEWNALLQCSDVFAIDTAYVTTEPCVICTKLFLNTSCHRIVAAEPYHGEGPELWRRGNRTFEFFA